MLIVSNIIQVQLLQCVDMSHRTPEEYLVNICLLTVSKPAIKAKCFKIVSVSFRKPFYVLRKGDACSAVFEVF